MLYSIIWIVASIIGTRKHFKFLFIYLFSAVLRLHCCASFPLVVASLSTFWLWYVGFSVCGFSFCRAGSGECGLQELHFLSSEQRLRSTARGLSCSMARGIFLGQGFEPSSPALADGFLTTGPQGKPNILSF